MDAVWAVCPGHHESDGNSAYWKGAARKGRKPNKKKQNNPKKAPAPSPNYQCGQSFDCSKVKRVTMGALWQCCRHLRVVRMPSSVVRIADNTFRGCQLLNCVTAAGCVEFGYKAFADCCSLQWVYANGGGVEPVRKRNQIWTIPLSRLHKSRYLWPARG